MKIAIREIDTSVFASDADLFWEDEKDAVHIVLACQHDNTEVEKDSFDYAGTHCSYGQSGTVTQLNAICQTCGEDVSEDFDWDNYFEGQSERN